MTNSPMPMTPSGAGWKVTNWQAKDWTVADWKVRQYCLLAVIALGLLLPGFNALPPLDRDESRFAQASRQMNQSGDFVDIRFQDQARHQKPIGIYWLQAASARLTGEHQAIWSYRLPSLLGALISVLLTAWLGELLFDRRSGFVGALMVASSIILGVEARMATTDAVLLATVLASQGALAYCFRYRQEKHPLIALLFWGSLAASILIKGPIAPLIVAVTITTLCAIERQGRWLLGLYPLPGLVGLMLLTAPWFVLIWIETEGAFFTASVGQDFWAKVISGQESKGFPPGFYLITALITFAPFSLLMISALPWGWLNRRTPSVYFIAAWLVPNWLLFELASTKLLHYTMPLLPALALLSARALTDYFRSANQYPSGSPEKHLAVEHPSVEHPLVKHPSARYLPVGCRLVGRLIRLSAVLGALIGIAMTVGIPATLILVGESLNIGESLEWLTIAGLSAAAAGMIVAAVSLWYFRAALSMAITLASMMLFYGTMSQYILPKLDVLWLSRQVGQAVSVIDSCSKPVVASAGYSEPSLIFTLGHATRLTDFAGAALHLQSDSRCHFALVEQESQFEFFAHLPYNPLLLGTVSGFNYNKGQFVRLGLFASPWWLKSPTG